MIFLLRDNSFFGSSVTKTLVLAEVVLLLFAVFQVSSAETGRPVGLTVTDKTRITHPGRANGSGMGIAIEDVREE